MSTIRNCWRPTVICLVIGGTLVSCFESAEARLQYRKHFIKQYPQVKERNSRAMNCLICHDTKDGSDTTPDHEKHNNYGTALKEVIEKNERDPKNIEESLREVESMPSAIEGKTFGDLLNEGRLPASKE